MTKVENHETWMNSLKNPCPNRQRIATIIIVVLSLMYVNDPNPRVNMLIKTKPKYIILLLPKILRRCGTMNDAIMDAREYAPIMYPYTYSSKPLLSNSTVRSDASIKYDVPIVSVIK